MTPPEPPPASLRLRLDRAALKSNWQALDRLSNTTVRTGAAVKADAYGLGAAQAVPVLAAAGCRDWFVAHWREVTEVIRHTPPTTIAVFHGPVTDADVAFAKATGVRPMINSVAQAQRWLSAGGGLCDVMVDTGMSRLGVPVADLGDAVFGLLDIDCCISHLASADEDTPQNLQQLTRFAAVRGQIRARRYSLANSAGIALGADYHADLTRPGLALYGGIARPELTGVVRQVAYPEAALVQVREIGAGDLVGYNATFTAPRPMRIGVVSVGYADGYLRCWSGKGGFSWQGQHAPVVGRISMDLTIVDLSDAPDCREGDWLSIRYDPVTAAQTSGLSQYELLTLLGRRFSRVD